MSDVVSLLVLVALLLRISDAARRPAPAVVDHGAARAALQDAPTQAVRPGARP